jgi:hypothetical protein
LNVCLRNSILFTQRMAATCGTRRMSSHSHWMMRMVRRRLTGRHRSIRRTAGCPALGLDAAMFQLAATLHPRRSAYAGMGRAALCLHTSWTLSCRSLQVAVKGCASCMQPQYDFESAHVNHTYTAAGGIANKSDVNIWVACLCTITYTLGLWM